MNNPLVKELAEAFLRWPLPDSVRADPCATTQGSGRTGTNLLSYTEAYEMIDAVVRPKIEDLLMRECMEHAQTIEQRDQAEEAADTLTSLVLGEPVDWPYHDAKWREAIEKLAADKA